MKVLEKQMAEAQGMARARKALAGVWALDPHLPHITKILAVWILATPIP